MRWLYKAARKSSLITNLTQVACKTRESNENYKAETKGRRNDANNLSIANQAQIEPQKLYFGIVIAQYNN
jgi:hypothetical protein